MQQIREKVAEHFGRYRKLYGLAVFSWFIQWFVPDMLIELRKNDSDSLIIYHLTNLQGMLIFLTFGLVAFWILGFKGKDGQSYTDNDGNTIPKLKYGFLNEKNPDNASRKIMGIIGILTLIFFLIALIK